jgi:hypothetical protein
MIAALIGGALGVAIDLIVPWAPFGGAAGIVSAGVGLLLSGTMRRALLALAAAMVAIALVALTIGHARETARSATAERDAARQALREAERIHRANLVALDQIRRRHDAELAALAATLDRTRALGRRAARAREETVRDPDANDLVAPAIARYLDRVRAGSAVGDAAGGGSGGADAAAVGPDAMRSRAAGAGGADRPGQPADVD